jgi:hypothetical protein
MWKIPYAKVSGHVQSLLIVSSRSPDSIKKAVRIPKTFVLFKWDYLELTW